MKDFEHHSESEENLTNRPGNQLANPFIYAIRLLVFCVLKIFF
jgi:hypothetical protein